MIPDKVAAALRDLELLDPDCERIVFRIRAHGDRMVLTATAADLDELIGGVAAEANHETNRRRAQALLATRPDRGSRPLHLGCTLGTSPKPTPGIAHDITIPAPVREVNSARPN